MSYPSNFRAWLAKIISFDTTSRNSNLPMVEYIRDYLQSVGVASTFLYNPEKTHANLWATLPGEGGVTQGGIVLSGHTDVVPVDGQKWDSDPFVMVEKDGKLFGRGACDMKGFIAVALALTPQFLSMKRAKPVHYAFSFDEEVGCTGVPYLVNYLKERGFKADACIVGEPTDMRVYVSAKGFTQWNVSVHGKAIHSSMALMNTSCNAIEYAAQIITKVREIALDIKKNGRQDPGHDCPFAPMTTALVSGGNAVNTVPAECSFIITVRITDKETPKEIEDRMSRYVAENILPAMREEYPEATVDIKNAVSLLPFNGKEDSKLTKQALKLCKHTKTYKTGGANEGGYFQDVLGIPTVVVGPGPGAMAHLANEYVLVDQMEKSTAFTMDMVKLYTDPTYCSAGNL
ncbi:glutamamyl carboxypeptidase putativemetallo-peptidase Clan MH Family M18 [Leptomonas pyrrhocoris]|uniref:Glutamamyl carboxypeptidase putativemetallo-peptidase Clan MH Family M18 n=1 Tax=Leptomonas pyrrhocoris TaxID=157538 RepID=A0A0M9G1Y9_LEPPY|nr:glutamamyl carboxypeptidase putativemetallo-peptidase Clan MH Family M18 [Leptomonas pyrrhocoris]KPA80529.1 glutamamyl carboxypeptidase putativemetallo-peptidase Clan MH Family M18 [Leptomonas pyrrhocoris]|eukprot:XP_015658968.1 glutamamyl carboxypeptidase putativemetallo-peptidase Clan MH Family M18 [Leptomonas pyrrhocoris]